MKKTFYVLIAILFVFATIGCMSKKEKIMNCSVSLNNESLNYSYNTQYKVTHVGNVVKKSELLETVTSESDDVIDYFETYLDSYYTLYKNSYGGVSWNITKSDGKIVSNTIFDYDNMDLDKLASDDEAFKSYLNDKNELTLAGLKTMYKSIGVTCE